MTHTVGTAKIMVSCARCNEPLDKGMAAVYDDGTVKIHRELVADPEHICFRTRAQQKDSF